MKIRQGLERLGAECPALTAREGLGRYLALGRAELVAGASRLAGALAHPSPLAENFDKSNKPKLAMMIVIPQIEKINAGARLFSSQGIE